MQYRTNRRPTASTPPDRSNCALAERGDAIEVDRSDSTLSYRVKSVNVLSKEEVARDAEEIFAQTGPDRLVIITCDDWDGSVWRSNIVTIATPV